MRPGRQWTQHAPCSKEGDDKAKKATAREATKVNDEVEGGEESYFAVDLFVAALGDGKLLFEGAARKKRDILEQVAAPLEQLTPFQKTQAREGAVPDDSIDAGQVVRNVSKEQNTVVQVPGESSATHLKMRVFAGNSIEAKACLDYIEAHPHQVLLIEPQLPPPTE